MRRYLKPYVCSIYSAEPGVFYGSGAIQPVESLITEMKEHHDLYLDEHKRSVMTILSVLERSGLTPRDLEFSPYAHWIMRNHDDVKVVQFPEINLQAFMAVHGLIDREIDRTSGSSTMMQGIPTTKRQTGTETQMLMAESSRRFSTFIHMADHLTLRPLAMKTMILMRNMVPSSRASASASSAPVAGDPRRRRVYAQATQCKRVLRLRRSPTSALAAVSRPCSRALGFIETQKSRTPCGARLFFDRPAAGWQVVTVLAC